MGTSTAGILQTELAYRNRDLVTGALPASFEYSTTHNSFSIADYVRRRCASRGLPCRVLRVRVQRQSLRIRETHDRSRDHRRRGGGRRGFPLFDHVVRVYSLQLSSALPAGRSMWRDGISIGEAAAFACWRRARALDGDEVLLLGVGESSDAYHMSLRIPRGMARAGPCRRAARRGLDAMRSITSICTARARRATIDPRASVTSVFGAATPGSSTKGATAIRWVPRARSRRSSAPSRSGADFCRRGQHHAHRPHAHRTLPEGNRPSPASYVLSNSFGFGGTNCSLIFGRPGASLSISR